MQWTPSHIKTRNFVQSIINRQYEDPSINIRHLPPPIDDPSINISHLPPAIEGPSTSTATGVAPSGPDAKATQAVQSIPARYEHNDFRRHVKKKKNWVPVRDRFDKPFVSNEKTIKALTTFVTPKVEELEKEDEEGEEGEEGEETLSTSFSSSASSSSSNYMADISSLPSSSSSSSASSPNYIAVIDDYQPQSDDPPVVTLPHYRCPTCFKIIKNSGTKNPANYYHYSVENIEAQSASPITAPPSPVTEMTTVSESEHNMVEEEVEEEADYYCTYNPKRFRRNRRSSDPKKVIIFNNKAEVKNFLFENDNFLLFSCLPTNNTLLTSFSNLSNVDSNLTQQNQKSPKKEGKIKTAFKKMYNIPKSIFGSVKDGFSKLYNSETFKRVRDVAVDKLEKGVKSVLGSETVNDLKKQAIEKGKDFTTKFGNALINRGAAIIAGSAIAAGK